MYVMRFRLGVYAACSTHKTQNTHMARLARTVDSSLITYPLVILLLGLPQSLFQRCIVFLFGFGAR